MQLIHSENHCFIREIEIHIKESVTGFTHCTKPGPNTGLESRFKSQLGMFANLINII